MTVPRFDACASESLGSRLSGSVPPPPPPPPIHFGVPEIEHLSRAVSLTDAQAAELKTFFEAQKPTFDAIHRRLEEGH